MPVLRTAIAIRGPGNTRPRWQVSSCLWSCGGDGVRERLVYSYSNYSVVDLEALCGKGWGGGGGGGGDHGGVRMGTTKGARGRSRKSAERHLVIYDIWRDVEGPFQK